MISCSYKIRNPKRGVSRKSVVTSIHCVRGNPGQTAFSRLSRITSHTSELLRLKSTMLADFCKLRIEDEFVCLFVCLTGRPCGTRLGPGGPD